MNEKLAHDFLVERNRAGIPFHNHTVGIYTYDFHEKYSLNGENN
jgi:hypothetical protein